MSGSSDTAPTPETLRDVQIWLNYLDRISPQQPATVIAETDRALPLLASWQSCDAYAWALALRAKAFRFLDDLTAVLSTANSGLTALGEHGGVISAHLHLEAGMALNQFDRQPEAAEHLRAADRAFEAANDPGGRAWALVSLAESHSGSGYPEDPEPVLTLAKHLAESVGDEPAIRRAWKQLSVVYRHRGEILNALDAIQHALDGAPDGHPRANYLLEWGHLLAWTADYAAADEAYEDAAAAYAEHGDVLGIANTERALAINALLLGRNTEGRRRLDRAVSNYREIDSAPGLGYTLRERAMLRLTEHDTAGALTDVEEALRSFRASPDTLGLAGALRAAARIRSVLGDMSGARDALSQARTITSAGSNPLAEANILLLEAEIEDTPDKRLAAAAAAANLYRRMRIATGEAHALSMTARAAADRSDTILVVSAMRQSIDALRRARRQVIDPGRRADHDFALRDVATTLLSVANVVRRPETTRMAADLLIDATPLGLRNTLQSGHLSSRVSDFLDRVRDLPLRSRTDPHSQRHLLQQLNVQLAVLDPSEAPCTIGFDDLAEAHPTDAVVIYGAPTRDSQLPLAYRIPGGETTVELVPLNETHIDQIDALGYAITSDRADVLWNPQMRSWQTDLTDVLLPVDVQRWMLRQHVPALSVVLPPILAHIPFEAVMLAGVPVGIRAAVTRLPIPTTARRQPDLQTVVAYLDPALSWNPERAALTEWTHYASEIRRSLGPNQLLLISCHGESTQRAEGALVASDGTRVVDAIDLLSHPLDGTVAVLEACFAGRYMGPRSGELLNLATVCLLGGATTAIAGLFALPADDACTGTIVATALHELGAGVSPAEAMRRARLQYDRSRPERVSIPGAIGTSMPSDAPWAWAGLCVFER